MRSKATNIFFSLVLMVFAISWLPLHQFCSNFDETTSIFDFLRYGENSIFQSLSILKWYKKQDDS